MSVRPAPLREVHIEGPFSPSRIVKAQECMLSAFAPSDADTLRPHPLAILGSGLHAALDQAGRRFGESESTPKDLLKVALERAEGEWAKIRGPQHDADLRTAVGAMEWARRVASTVRAIGQIIEVGAGRTPRAPRILSTDWGPEVWLEDASLQVRGRVDLILRDGDSVIVTDWKSGKVTDAERDELNQDVRLQLEIYGLLAAARESGYPVRLRVVGATTFEWPFDDGARARALSAIEAVREVSGANEATSLARPGPMCAQCGVRHLCGSYRASAPGWWAEPPDWRIPVDAWGRVQDVQGTGDLVTLFVDRPAAGAARVQNVSAAHFERAVQVGDWFEGFGLTRDDGAWRRGVWSRNFMEVGLHPGQTTAWSATCWMSQHSD